MGMRIVELRCKEVVNICDGQRLGFVSDVEVRIPDGQVCALIVPAPCRFMGLVGSKEDYVIPWNCIRRMGEDIILVELEPGHCRMPRSKPKLF